MRSTIRNTRLRRLILNSLLFVLLLIQIVSHAAAQSSLDGSLPSALKPGSPAGSYESSMDTINLFNGHLNFRIPLITIGGGGRRAYRWYFH